MSTLEEVSEIFPDLRNAVNEVRHYGDIRDDEFVAGVGGEMNMVLVGDRYIIRVPYGSSRSEQIRRARFESHIVSFLGDAVVSPPVHIPTYYDRCTEEGPPYALYTKVPGTGLSQDKIRNLTVDEKQMYGQATGEFVGWMGKAFAPWIYSAINDLYNPKVFDRETIIHKKPRAHIPDTLTKILLDLQDEHTQRLADGSLTPSIVGHDDLHPGNVTFCQKAGSWALQGIFDFGLTKHSSPERELRHIATLGPDALEPAIDAYQDASGATLSRELIQFWALVQTSWNYAYAVRTKNLARAMTKHRDLKQLLPAYTG